MAGSAYAVAKARLVTKLDAHATLTSKVTYGDAEANGARELVMVLASPGEADEIWATIGNQARDEEFDIVVLCEVVRPGDSQQEATERAFELLGRIETVLRSNPRLNGSHWCELVPQRLAEQPGDDGYQAAAEARVAVFARK